LSIVRFDIEQQNRVMTHMITYKKKKNEFSIEVSIETENPNFSYFKLY